MEQMGNRIFHPSSRFDSYIIATNQTNVKTPELGKTTNPDSEAVNLSKGNIRRSRI